MVSCKVLSENVFYSRFAMLVHHSLMSKKLQEKSKVATNLSDLISVASIASMFKKKILAYFLFRPAT